MSQENVEVVRAGFEAWNAGDMEALRELLDSGVVLRMPQGWPEPGPLMIRLELIVGNAPVRLIVPLTEKLIVSDPLLLPATHSPAVTPDAVLLFAAVIASRKVHKPSVLFATSEVLLTVIVLAAGVIGFIGARAGSSASASAGSGGR